MGQMASLRHYYGVPAQRGGLVQYLGDGYPRDGHILSAKDHKLWVYMYDTERREGPFHPTWEFRYVRPERSYP